MPNTLSETEICNLALDFLDEAPINDFLSDTGMVARFFRRNFWPIAWSLIRKHPWNFAIVRAQLAASPTAPLFGFQYAYPYPQDCLRVLPVTYDGTERGRPVTYKVENAQVLTDMTAPLKVRYLQRIDDNNGGVYRFDQQFVDCHAIAMAQKAAHLITGKASYADKLQQAATAALLDARLYDSLEGTPEDAIADEWLLARQGWEDREGWR